MTETFYDVLGVSDDATVEEIESAYREEIKRVHPDVSDEVDASDRTKRLNKAKRILSDADERARYDRIGHDAYVNGGPGAGNVNGSSGTGSTAGGTSTGSASRNPSGESSGGPSGESSGGSSNGWCSTSRSGSSGTSSGGTFGSESTWRGRKGSRRRGAERSGAERRRRAAERQRRSTPGETGNESGPNGASTTGATTRSRADSTGPEWQSGTSATDGSRSARRQAAATGPDSANVDWSWNAWDPRDAWAVRQSGDVRSGFRWSRLFPSDQSLVLLASTFLCYPLFVATVLFPAFPLVVRMTVLVCTLFTFAYLLSMPEVAVLVYGAWSVIGTLGLLAFPGAGVFSLLGVVVLVATWFPLGISILTLSILRP